MKYKDIQNPTELSEWMMKNITYGRGDEDTWTLNSPQNTINEKVGQCYDQAILAYEWLKSNDYRPMLYYWVAYNDKTLDGTTHMMVVYRDDGLKYFENAWENNAGLHSGFDSIKSIKEFTKKLIRKEHDFKEFNKLFFTKIDRNQLSYGMSFDEFQSIAQEKLDVKSL